MFWRTRGATADADRVVCGRQYFSSVHALVILEHQWCDRNDDLRDEPMHPLLRGIAPLVLPPQFGLPLRADGLAPRYLLLAPCGALYPGVDA